MKNIDFSCLELGNFTTVWEFYILLSCEERPVDVTQTSHNSSIKPCQGNIWWWQLAKGREDIAMHWRGLKRCLRFRVLKCWGRLYWQGMVDVLDISISKLLRWIILTGWVLEMQEAGRQISLLTLPSWSTLDCLTSWTSWNNKTPKLGTPSSTQDHA